VHPRSTLAEAAPTPTPLSTHRQRIAEILAALSERETEAKTCAVSAEVGVAADGLRTHTRTRTVGPQVLPAS